MEKLARKKKEKSQPKASKPELIFAEPSSPQFGIPAKLSDKVLGVTKLTNKDEENKYLDQPLLTHSKQYIKKSFKDSVKLFKTTVGKPLKTLVFLINLNITLIFHLKKPKLLGRE